MLPDLSDIIFNFNLDVLNRECKDMLLNAYRFYSTKLVELKAIDSIDISAGLPRELRRQNAKSKKKLFSKVSMRDMEELSNLYYDAYNEFNGKKSCFTKDDYYLLLIDAFNSIVTGNKQIFGDKERLSYFVSLFNEIIRENIAKSKKANISTPLLDCYNIDGELRDDKLEEFINVLRRLTLCSTVSLLKNNHALNCEVNIENLLIYFDKDDKYKAYVKAKKQKEKEESLERERIRRENAPAKKNIVVSQPTQVKKMGNMGEIIQREIYKYVTTDLVLKKNILDLISYDEFSAVLERDGTLSKKKINDLLCEYKELYIEKMIGILNNSLSEKYRVILTRVAVCDNDETRDIYLSLRNAIFDSRNNDSLDIDALTAILSRYKVSVKNDKKNIVMFPSDEIFESNLDSVLETTNNNPTALRGIAHSLKVLETQDFDKLKTKEKGFHEIKNNSNTSFVLGSLKGYRYGAKKTKICLFKVSVCEENKKVLRELYNFDDSMSIFLVFGFGDVSFEVEKDLYSRAIYIAESNSEELNRINDLFYTPFTSESLEEAKRIIESSMNGIDKIKKYELK